MEFKIERMTETAPSSKSIKKGDEYSINLESIQQLIELIEETDEPIIFYPSKYDKPISIVVHDEGFID